MVEPKVLLRIEAQHILRDILGPLVHIEPKFGTMIININPRAQDEWGPISIVIQERVSRESVLLRIPGRMMIYLLDYYEVSPTKRNGIFCHLRNIRSIVSSLTEPPLDDCRSEDERISSFSDSDLDDSPRPRNAHF